MNIRIQIALVIGVCSAVALGLAVWVGSMLVDRVAKRGEHGALWMAVKDSERIVEATGTFLVTADLVMASGETHLLDGGLDQADRIHGIAAELAMSEQRHFVAEPIARIRAVVVTLAQRMESVATTEESVPFDELEAHDADAASLVALTQGFYDELKRKGAAADRELVVEDGKVQNLILAALVAYIAFALFAWHVTCRRLAASMAALRSTAEVDPLGATPKRGTARPRSAEPHRALPTH